MIASPDDGQEDRGVSSDDYVWVHDEKIVVRAAYDLQQWEPSRSSGRSRRRRNEEHTR